MSEDRRKKLAERQVKMSTLFSDGMGVSPEYVYEVNSKSQNDEQLNQVFAWIMSEKTIKENVLNLDWAKKEIEDQ